MKLGFLLFTLILGDSVLLVGYVEDGDVGVRGVFFLFAIRSSCT